MNLKTAAIAFAIAGVAIAGCQSTRKPVLASIPLLTFVPEFNFRGSARLGGVIGIDGGCLVLVQGDGGRYTPIWSEARLERDENGWLVRDVESGEVVRPGDHVIGSGGVLIETSGAGWSRARVNDLVEPDLPERCRFGVISFHSFRRESAARP